MCGVVPTPPEPKFIVPFFAFASAISSWIDLIGESAFTTATTGARQIASAMPNAIRSDVRCKAMMSSLPGAVLGAAAMGRIAQNRRLEPTKACTHKRLGHGADIKLRPLFCRYGMESGNLVLIL